MLGLEPRVLEETLLKDDIALEHLRRADGALKAITMVIFGAVVLVLWMQSVMTDALQTTLPDEPFASLSPINDQR